MTEWGWGSMVEPFSSKLDLNLSQILKKKDRKGNWLPCLVLVSVPAQPTPVPDL